LLFWVPVILGLSVFASHSVGICTSCLLYTLGIVLWTLYEYLFHRFLFHMDARLPDHPLAFAVHFLIHGVHHFLPTDRYRLTMPPLLMTSLATPVAFSYHFILGIDTARTAAIMAGSLTGYLAYDMLHYAFHHAPIKRTSYLHTVKSHHMRHHFVSTASGFGVSSHLWDTLFGTNHTIPPNKAL